MKRKLVKSGNSLAVTLPSDLVKELGIKPGTEVDVNADPAREVITIRLQPRQFEGGKATRKFRQMVNDLLTERAEVHRRLS